MRNLLLITRGIVIFPHTQKTLDIGRQKSINVIRAALAEKRKGKPRIATITQIDPNKEEIDFQNIYHIGTLCEIDEVKELEDGSYRVTLIGLKRISLTAVNQIGNRGETIEKSFFECEYTNAKQVNNDHSKLLKQLELLLSMVKKNNVILAANDKVNINTLFNENPDPSKIVDVIASLTPSSLEVKQSILEEFDVSKRIDLLIPLLSNEDDLKSVDYEINKKMSDSLNKQQKEFYLREKMRLLKEELGQISPKDSEENNLRKRINDNPYPQHIKDRVNNELNHMESTNNPQENAINRTYVE